MPRSRQYYDERVQKLGKLIHKGELKSIRAIWANAKYWVINETIMTEEQYYIDLLNEVERLRNEQA
jgi:hypothetical protein